MYNKNYGYMFLKKEIQAHNFFGLHAQTIYITIVNLVSAKCN